MNNTRPPSIYLKKLNGFRASHRNKWLLLQSGLLSPQALLLHEFYIDVYDFDPRHETYATFETDFSQIARIFNRHANTVRNWHDELMTVGLISKGNAGRFRLHSPARYVATRPTFQGKATEFSNAEKNQSVGIIFQYVGGKLQPSGENIQSVGEETGRHLKPLPPIGIVSSKVESKFNDKEASKEIVRLERDVKEAFSDSLLSEDDKRWIDEDLNRRFKSNTIEQDEYE